MRSGKGVACAGKERTYTQKRPVVCPSAVGGERACLPPLAAAEGKAPWARTGSSCSYLQPLWPLQPLRPRSSIFRFEGPSRRRQYNPHQSALLQIDPLKEECFHERANAGEVVDAKVLVYRGGKLDIKMRVRTGQRLC